MRPWVAIGLACLAPAVVAAQVIPVRPPPPRGPGDTLRTRGDTTKKDSTGVKWAPPDSVMRALMAKKGYTVTLYQGNTVTLDLLTKTIDLAAGMAKKAALQRSGQTISTDSTLHIHDRQVDLTTKRDSAQGGCKIDPGPGQPSITRCTSATYNLDARSGRINEATFAVGNGGGAEWYVHPSAVKIEQGDSTRDIPQRFYAQKASLTSCPDSIPDYYFEVGELKRTKTALVGRPAILVIGGVPVMWFPIFFQDIRSGRKSGILTPRFGVSDIVRNSPTYKRDIENIGYYWAVSDYMDAQTWFDWRSETGGTGIGDPGFMRFNGEWRYRWRDRFLTGQLATSYTTEGDGTNNTAVSWMHSQDFSRDSHLNANINYVTSTTIQRQNTFNPYAALATISSALAFQDKLGPAQLSIGGTRKQYPGRQQIDQTFPTLSLTTSPVSLGSWLVWTPGFNYSVNQSLHIDQPGLFSERFFTDANGALDSVAVKRSSTTTTASFDTPLSIFGWKLSNSFRYNNQQNIFPQEYVVYPNPNDTSVHQSRVFASTFRTDVDWTPSFELPSAGQNALHLTPSVSLVNVDPSAFWVMSERTGGKFVSQTKRPVFSLSAAPSIYGLLPGLGPFDRFRHTISPTFGYSYAPAAAVSDEFLTAIGRERPGYLGSLKQNSVNFGLNQILEAKMHKKQDTTAALAPPPPAPGDTTQPGAAPPGGPGPGTAGTTRPSTPGLAPGQLGAAATDVTPIKLLSLSFSPLTYDFERAKQTQRPINGLTTPTFTYALSSDLLPGFQVSVGYSLFQGDNLSDSARFSPFRNSMSATFNVSQQQNPFGFIGRLFGIKKDTTPVGPATGVTGGPVGMATSDAYAQQLAAQPVAGSASRTSMPVPPAVKSWSASFSFSAARQRPPIGGTVINADPRRFCAPFNTIGSPTYNPAAYDLCIQQQSTAPTLDSPIPNTSAGGPVYLNPPTSSVGTNISLPLTDKWSATWQTTYDFVNRQFASQIVNLQRDLHDWTANFSFTQSPNGNFSFGFFIALKADQDLKFNYNRSTYGGIP